jgi:hypothetical protein
MQTRSYLRLGSVPDRWKSSGTAAFGDVSRIKLLSIFFRRQHHPHYRGVRFLRRQYPAHNQFTVIADAGPDWLLNPSFGR